MLLKGKNNASGQLYANLDSTSLTCQVTNGHTFTGIETPFNMTIYDIDSNNQPTNYEIVQVTNIATDTLYDTFTIIRAQEGTVGIGHLANKRCANFITYGIIDGINDELGTINTSLDDIYTIRESEVYTATGGESTVPITIDYDPLVDILNVYYEGILMNYTTEYTATTDTITLVGFTADAGYDFTINVYSLASKGDVLTQIADLQTDVGDASTLDTTSKEVVGAINENTSQLSQKANKTQEDWIRPTLLNSFEDYDEARHIRYMKDEFGFVKLEGMAKTGSSGVAIFNLPVGYRPPAGRTIRYFVATGNTTSGVRVAVTDTGDVIIEAAYTTYVDLSSIRFGTV